MVQQWSMAARALIVSWIVLVVADVAHAIENATRHGAAVTMLDGAIVAIGGVDESSTPSHSINFIEEPARSAALRLTRPRAFAAAVTWDGSVILAGGIDRDGPSRSVERLRVVEGTLETHRLPDLPLPLAGGGGVIVSNHLYVFGGVDENERPSNRLFRLALNANDATWVELDPLPAVGRVRATVATSFAMVHVIGGRFAQRDAQGVTRWIASDEVWTYRPRPVDGTQTVGWIKSASLPMPLGISTSVSSGQSHVIVAAGDVESSLDSWRSIGSTSSPSLAFHSVTDTWTTLNVDTTDRPGSTLVRVDGSLKLVGDRVQAFDLPRPTGSLRFLDYAAIAIYFVGMAMIGFYFARKNKSSDEFSLGNRNVKWWAGAISMYATGVSSISLMAIPVLGFTSNLVFLIPVFFMLPQAVIQATYIVPLLRKLEITSTYEYLERRFNMPLRLLASAQAISFQSLGRMSIVLLLPSLALSATTGLDVYLSILVMGVLTTIYTAVGGFEAVIWTDVAQGVIMFAGPILIVIFALQGAGGGVSDWVATGIAYEKFTPVLFTWDFTVYAIWIAILAAILTVAGFAGDQPIVQRVYATPLKDVKRLQYMFAILGVLVAVLVTAVGISLFLFYHANPGRLDVGMTNDQLVPRFIIDVLPTGIAGVLIAAIFAAAMSTMSSSMNSVSVLVSEDFYRRFTKSADDARRLRLMKLVSYLVGVVGTTLALVMATWEIRSIFETWNRMAALLGGGFVGIYALGMFTTRANAVGAFAGAIASVFWTLWAQTTSMHWTLLAPSATLACIVIGYVVSLATGGSKRDLSGLTVFTVSTRTRAVNSHPTQLADAAS